MTSDEKGQAACTLDLPLGSYYVKELKAPDGFVSSDEVLRFGCFLSGAGCADSNIKIRKEEPADNC